MKSFEKVNFNNSEINIMEQEISQWKSSIFRPSFKNWKILFFLIPPILAIAFLLINYKVEIDWIAILELAIFLAVLLSVNLVLRLIELKLGYKRIGNFKIAYSLKAFGFRIIFLKWFLPLIVSTKNEIYTPLKRNDIVQIEFTGLFRFSKWSVRKNASW